MPIVALSVTEAELYSAVLCAQDMLFIMRLLGTMGLRVKLPMKLYIDNSGANDFCHGWSSGGRTRHIEVKQYFLREMKEEGLIETVWKAGTKQRSDLFTKNLARPLFETHIVHYVGVDRYMAKKDVMDEIKAREQGRVSHGARSNGETENWRNG